MTSIPTSKMPDTLIPDTSCLIFLGKTQKLYLLKALYPKIVTTEAVAKEHGLPLPDWITIENPQSQTVENQLRKKVDPGEASIMALAQEKNEGLVSLDDRKARKVALDLGLTITGTLGIIYKAKQEGHLSTVKETLKHLKEVHFRISENVEHEILRMAGE
jgi:predicted nucleic acid-binding protein